MFNLLIGKLRNVQQAFKFVLEFNKHTKVRDLGDLAFDTAARAVLLWNGCFPWVVSKLLQSQSDTAAVLIDRQDFTFERFTLLQHLIRV